MTEAENVKETKSTPLAAEKEMKIAFHSGHGPMLIQQWLKSMRTYHSNIRYVCLLINEIFVLFYKKT